MHGFHRLFHSAHYLLVFEAAARRNSFTEVARELNVAQPAVSLSTKQLEAAPGVTVFARGHRSVTLTYVGEVLSGAVSSGFGRMIGSAEQSAARSARRT